MSVLVYAEQFEGTFKKQSFEAVNYAKKTADQLGCKTTAIVFGSGGEELGKYGADNVISITNPELQNFDSSTYAQAIAAIAKQENSNVVIISNTPNGKAFAPRVAVKLNAGIVSGVTQLPTSDFQVQKSVFSGKGFANYSYKTETKVIALQPNSIGFEQTNSSAQVEERTVDLSSVRAVKVKEQHKKAEGIPLPDAELVVSAGRGLKGPENWDMIETMARNIGAATACSRPVADSDWRPHHEHVGQTGVAIRPNLYIAIGISGAIQHLAGVNQSKVIVVINKDPEAPFFKEADYGIVGDAFEIIPQLNKAWEENHK